MKINSSKMKWPKNVSESEDSTRQGQEDSETIPSDKKRKLSGEAARKVWLECSGKSLRAESVHCSAVFGKRMRRELSMLQLQIAMISDGDGDRPIHVAVVNEDLELVQKLSFLMKKAAVSLDINNYLRQTPLHLAVMIGNPEIVNFLINHGASVCLRDRNGNSVIHLAVKANASEEILSLILSHPQAKKILDIMDHEGYSALHYAVFQKNFAAVKCLSYRGADINAIDGKSGRTALIHAVLSENAEMVKVLLSRGACILKSDYSGHSAFDLALQLSSKPILKLMEDSRNLEEASMSNSNILNESVEKTIKMQRKKSVGNSIEQTHEQLESVQNRRKIFSFAKSVT
ncbi:B-cell lymphoma 3 protein homolog [Uloborus diversus]|uniref:B-cell lymphoma 3 protein homolog n=1 Tax=Uloborus diversus TaxID=327109 RepID=UPI002408F2F8|nr:B-cell lymphoma 3 protein homolog [Uloborus diversus]